VSRHEPECFNCGAPASEPFGNAYLCAGCAEDPGGGDDDPNGRDDAERRTDAVAEDDGDGHDGDGGRIEAGVYPTDLKDVSRWLTWKPTDDGRKVPRAPHANPDRPDLFVSAQDSDVWTDHATAAKWVDHLPSHGLAFNIPDRDECPDDPFVLVDYDDARDPETGAIHPVVRDHLKRAESYADVSTSGTGIHIFARGRLPDGVKAIDAALPHDEQFPDAELEVYDSGRYSAMTGDHLAGTPRETTDCQDFLAELASEFATVAEGTPDELTREPETSRDELADVETTNDLQDVLDAIQHTAPRDIRLRSAVTHERTDGSKSLDPAWASSKSGTRLAQVGDGWVYRKGMHGLDALQIVALEERIITSVDEYPSGEAFWEAVDALRDRGAHIPEFKPGADVEQVPVLPDTPGLQGAASGWDWRHAGRDDGALSIDDARARTTDAIADAYEHGDRCLVEALPTMGKSYGAVKAAAETDTPVTILTGRGRKEQYEQFREWCDEYGLSYKTLPAFTRDCDTANGEHGAEWTDTVRSWYHRGATPQAIHKWAEDALGRPLPCQEHEGQRCPYASKWDFDPDEYDVLIGHYNHAHKSKVTAGRVAVFDEFPGGAYEVDLGEDLQEAVSYWLATTEAVPFEDYTDLLEHRDDPQRRSDALAWFLEGGPERAERQVFDDRQAHAAAPLAVFTLLASDDLGNGVEVADLEDVGTGVFNRETGAVTVLQPPALEYATGVVALDGTPTREMWELALGGRLNHRAVLQPEERAAYVRDALNLNLVRTTDAVKPYNSADHVATDQDAALLEAIADEHGQPPAVITSATARDEYDAAGVLDVDPESGEVGSGPAKHVKWYGDVLGSNEYDDTRVGAVIGSNHYGDDYIKKWGAYAGEAVERDAAKGSGLSYGDFGDRVLTHMREHDTLQAAMRFGRDGNGAVVYVHTDTLPEWVPLAGEGRVVTTWSDGMRAVVDALDELGSATTAAVAERVDVGRRQVFDHLETLREQGVLVREQDPDDGRRVRWCDDGLERVGDHGEADLGDVSLDDLNNAEVAELARTTIYTWEFRNSAKRGGDTAGQPPDKPERVAHAATDGGDPPPEVADGRGR